MLPLDVFIVRHFESEGNAALRKYEKWLKQNWFLRLFRHPPFTPEFLRRHHPNFRLTDKGKEQGLPVGMWLKEWLKEKKLPYFDGHMVSTHTRTIETAVLLDLPGAAWKMDFQLRERDIGMWGAISDRRWEKRHAKSLRLHQNHHFYTPWPNGESIANVCDRLRNLISALDSDGLNQKRVVVVAHGDVMQAFRVIFEGILPNRYDELSKANLPDFRIGNGQIIHYTRVDPTDHKYARYDRFGWVRSLNPWCPEYAGHDWRAIEPHRYSNNELMNFVKRFPCLIK